MYVILAMGPIRGGGEAVGEGGYERAQGMESKIWGGG